MLLDLKGVSGIAALSGKPRKTERDSLDTGPTGRYFLVETRDRVGAGFTTKTAVVLITVMRRKCLNRLLCVNRNTASSVMTAPLCGQRITAAGGHRSNPVKDLGDIPMEFAQASQSST